MANRHGCKLPRQRRGHCRRALRGCACARPGPFFRMGVTAQDQGPGGTEQVKSRSHESPLLRCGTPLDGRPSVLGGQSLRRVYGVSCRARCRKSPAHENALSPNENLVLVPPFPAGAGIRPVHPTTQRKPRLNPVAPLPRLGQLELLPDLQGGAVVFSHAIHRQQLFQGDVMGGGDCSAGVSGNDLVRLP